jgi:hypothetical protein
MRGMVAEADSWLYPSNKSNGPGMKGCFLAADFVRVLTRKVFERVAYADRTANRHRCSGRVDQGVRVILRQGTRQYSDRNLGIRSASPQCLQRCGYCSFLRSTL